MRTGAWRTAGLVLVIAVTAVATACSVGPSEPLVATEVAVEAPGPPMTISGGACIDTTDSMPPEVAARVIDSLAALVQNWVPPAGDRTAGSAAVPGLDLRVRKVLGDSSLALAGEVRHVTIPGVPPVMAKPAVNEDGYIEKVRAWRGQVQAADEATEKARVRSQAEAAAIRAADWSSTRSEIAGCLEGLALTTRGPSRAWILVSDLEQNEPVQVGLADLEGARVLIVQACDKAKLCIDQQLRWSQALSDRGAAQVAFARAEQAGEALAAWLRGEGS
jgi:hypothetical protein